MADNRISFKLGQNKVSWVFIVAGCVLFGISLLCPPIWKDLCIALSGSCFTIGLLELVMSISTVKNYIRTSIDHMYQESFLNNLDENKLMEIREKATTVLLKKHFRIEKAGDKFLEELNQSILGDVLSDYYLKNYEIDVCFQFDDDPRYITKVIQTSAEYAKTTSNCIEIEPFKSKKMITIPSREDIYKINKLSVNGIEIDKGSYEKNTTKKDSGDPLFPVIYKNDYRIPIAKDRMIFTVEQEVALLLPDNDPKTTFILNCPCEKMKVDYRFMHKNNERVKLDGSAFCSKRIQKKGEETKKESKISRSSSENKLTIRVNGSMLRGEGVVLFYQKL
jgi:hypothetical protein